MRKCFSSGILKKMLSMLVVFALVLSLVPATALAAGETKTIYLNAGGSSLWDQSGAWFDAWVWGSSQADAWYTFTDPDMDGVYEIQVPTDATGMKILRKDPANKTHSWTAWNQTGDLTIGSTYNCYKITNWSGGSWTSFTPAATTPVLTVVGAAGLCGTEWDVANTANDMTQVSPGVYQKVFTNVAAGTYQYKVAKDHAWTQSWGNGSDNASVSVAEAGSTVTVTFDGATRTVSAKVTKEYGVTFQLTNVTASGAATVVKGASYTATLTAAEGYKLPDSVTVTVGGVVVASTYDAATGALTVENVTGEVVITAEGVYVPKIFTVTFEGSNLTFTGEANVTEGETYTATLTAAEGYTLPETVTVTVAGAEAAHTYDAATGTVTVANVTGNVVITAQGVEAAKAMLYLKPNSNWVKDGARFAAYFFGNGEAWVSMTDPDGDGIYEVEIPEGFTKVIFCRMNPSAAANNWSNKWNQTGDLNIPTDDKNLFTIPAGAWDNSTTSWGVYTPAAPVVHTYTVAGVAGLCGTEWDVANTANDMEKTASGTYQKVYTNVAGGSYQFKVAQDHGWDVAYPGSNYSLTVAKDGSTVTITFDPVTKAVSAIVEAPAEPEPQEFTVTLSGTNVTLSGAATVTEGAAYTATLAASEGYTLPETITVTVGGTEAAHTYDAATGVVTIENVTGDVVITVAAVPVPEEPATITVYFRNDWLWSEVRVFYWNAEPALTWPGIVMEKVGTATYDGQERDVYAAQIPAGASFLFNGPENGNPTNTQQTPDITDGADGDAYYIHWADGNQVSKFDYIPAGGEGGEGEGGEGEGTETTYQVTFHFANTLNWGTVNLYTWIGTGTQLTGGWPGTAVTVDADGFYTATVSYTAATNDGLNFIFNNGSAQTVDLKVAPTEFTDNKAEKWVVLTSQTDGKYNATLLDDPASIVVSPVVDGSSVTFRFGGDAASVAVAGSFNGWTPAAMTKDAEGVWTLTVTGLASGDYQYKFVINGTDWITDPMNGNLVTDPDGNANSAFYILSTEAEDDNKVTVRIHYTRADGKYDGWNMWVWGSNMGGHQVDFTETDPDGSKVAIVVLEDARAHQNLSFKERLSVEGNEWKDQGSSDRSVDLSTVVSGTIDYYIPSGSVVFGDDVVRKNKVSSVSVDYDNDGIVLTTVQAIADPEAALKLQLDGTDVPVTVQALGTKYTLRLPESDSIDLAQLYRYKVLFEGAQYSVDIAAAYASDRFAAEYTYTGTDLGAAYTSGSTTFRVWAPTAEAVSVQLYATGSDSESGAAKLAKHEMTKDVNGTWIVTVAGDLNGVYYTYLVTVDGEEVEANDPYSVTTGVNGHRSMVLDLNSTNPSGWSGDRNPNPVTHQTDAVIYELHVRDFSIDPSSGVSAANRGKFLAFTENGTTVGGAGAAASGVDYLKSLGITHLHLLPVYDYASVDETTSSKFNWGYDPQNYNVPEGSYSTNPYKGEVRVKEMKQMVQALHNNGISVVMDVVYNHVYDASTFSFNRIVPGYFSRVSSNASGCGNDTASEREMVRKYIVESVLYWTEEYHIDGFRFDLVGLIDVQTINEIVTEVHKIRPDVIFYGEGWDMDSTNKESGTQMAKQGNASKVPGFAFFSDSIRNGIAGDNSGANRGFASGSGNGGAMIAEWLGNPWWTKNPQQVVQYASCHDNYTLADKLILSTGKSTVDTTVIKMNNLAATFYLTAQGMPFIHAGEELLREKINPDGSRNHNSYNSPDSVNHIDWNDVITYADNSAYYKGVIAFRKAHPALRLTTSSQIQSRIFTRSDAGDLLAFWIDGRDLAGETHDSIYVIFNASASAQSLELPAGLWDVCVDGSKAGTKVLSTVSGTVTVPGISAMILVQETSTEEPSAGTSVKSDVALPGSFNGWNTANFMNYAEDSTTVVTQKLSLPAGTYSFKVKIGDTWYGNNGAIEDTTDTTSATGWDMDAYAGDCTLKASGGAYTFLFDTATRKLIIRHDPEGGNFGDPKDYYLYGWINNADYAMGIEPGDYKFDENGKLTVTFTADSYVCVKNGDSSEKYMTQGWLGGVTSAKMYNVAGISDITGYDKLMIPGGSQVTLTLVHNDDGTVTLSYSMAASAVKDETGIQDGVTLHCWNWSFAQIEANMPLIAAQGYTAIQTSPVQPLKEATNLSGHSVGGNWWVYYQPVDFTVTTASGNALGTKTELASMIRTAHSYGIQVIVDVVANHLGNRRGNDLSTEIPEYLLKDEYWHDITVNTSNYNDRFDVTQHCMGGLPDLNTANDEVQQFVLDFLKECVDLGVDGFRFDAAKHIETPDDGANFASDFWPTVVGGAESYAKEKFGKDLYIYGEVLDTINGLPLSAYTKYMAITDNSWGNALRNSVASGNAALSAGYNKAVGADVLVLWAESHDTFATDDASQSSAGVSEKNILKTWALVAARADAMGLFFARPESTKQAIGVASVTGWADPAVKAVNRFHNAFAGKAEVVSNENGVSYVERGDSGVVLVQVSNARASAVSVTAHAMADGTYIDQITGNEFTVANGVISGQIGDSGIAVVYNAPKETTYEVKIDAAEGGKAEADATEAALGQTVTVTVTPDEGKKLDKLTVTDESGKELTVTDLGDGKYSFLQPEGKVTVKVTFADKAATPPTGDSFLMVPVFMGMAVSLAGIYMVLLSLKKNRRA